MGETEVVLIHFNIFNDVSQHDHRVLSVFAPNKWSGQLLSISGKSFIFKKKTSIQGFHVLK